MGGMLEGGGRREWGEMMEGIIKKVKQRNKDSPEVLQG